MGGWIAILLVLFFILREKLIPKTPAENWANKELIHKDRMAGMSEKEILRNVDLGKYKLQQPAQHYPEPHRDPQNNKIIIENSTLYYEDIQKHGAYQAQQWMQQGKYNLNKEELEIEHLRSKRRHASSLIPKSELDEMDRILSEKSMDWRNTEAVCVWRRANNSRQTQ